ncbi:MAG: hypothetical protein DI582_06990 [Azospirillum brasilense]|nr:MAG: hypothetical protein DI582_06990 [Azospirillum brasilense]
MSKNAFSLVELSIVLVILGLLTGGILGGQALIRAAELRSISTDFNKYVTAARTFRDKYFGLAGDITNATKFWGQDAGGCPGNNTTATTPGTATCDGSGDGTMGAGVNYYEVYRGWQQLANAGLIEGSFTGVCNSATCTGRINSIATPNVPKARLNNAAWTLIHSGTIAVNDVGMFDGTYGHVLLLGNTGADPMGSTGTSPPLKPEEAWNIDTKMDDGKPGTGSVLSPKTTFTARSDGTGCSDVGYTTASSIAASSNYQLSNSSAACPLVMKTGY